jgi:hypothetical protein
MGVIDQPAVKTVRAASETGQSEQQQRNGWQDRQEDAKHAKTHGKNPGSQQDPSQDRAK